VVPLYTFSLEALHINAANTSFRYAILWHDDEVPTLVQAFNNVLVTIDQYTAVLSNIILN